MFTKKNDTLFAKIIILFVFACFQGFAQNSQEFTATQIENDDLIIIGPEFEIPTAIDADVYSYVSLKVKGNTAPYTAYKFSITLSIIPLLPDGTPETALTVDLEVENNFSTNIGNVIDLKQYILTNKYIGSVSVVGHTFEDVENNGPIVNNLVPENIVLEVGYNKIRYYELPETAPNATASATNNELTISWNSIPEARYYDVEWTWVDNYGDDVNVPLDANIIPFSTKDFERNSTRVQTKETSYDIPLVYSKGYIIYRVRAVGNFLNDLTRNKYSPWSSGTNEKVTVANWSDKDSILVDHELSTKNWQFQASYAEDGKKKEVVSYFDGSLRNRQTVTTINTDQNAVVGEVIYDAQGRPAVEVLPVPTSVNVLKYHNNFNLNISGDPYSYLDFDKETQNIVDQLSADKKMGVVNGASNYYSPSNTFTGANRDRIPDAAQYPFSQIEYTPDNTGRIRRKSGVGETHQLGSGHEMEYYYGVPEQIELNRLFGYAVGNVVHYKKNMVLDPNRQLSVSYIDPQGRTIATALAGNVPIDENLMPLDDEVDENDLLHQTLTIDLLNKVTATDTDTPMDNNEVGASGTFAALQDQFSYNAIKAAVFDDTRTFNYNATSTIPYFTFGCVTSNLFPLIYKLNIDVLNEDAETLLVAPIEYSVNLGNSNLFTLPENTINVKRGTFTINKTLKVDRETAEAYADAYIAKLQDPNDDCYVPKTDISPVPIIIDGCFESCEDCELSIKNVYATAQDYVSAQLETYQEGELSQTEIDDLSIVFTNQYNEAIIACNAPCNENNVTAAAPEILICQTFLDQLLDDMSPLGQYGNGTIQAPNTFLNIFRASNALFSTKTNVSQHNSWKNPYHPDHDGIGNRPNANQGLFTQGHYYNEDGSISKIKVKKIIELDENDEETISYEPAIDDTGINNLTPTEDVAISSEYWVEPQYLLDSNDLTHPDVWQDSWAYSLLVYHPEYDYVLYSDAVCELTYSSSLGTFSSDGFDAYLQSITSYSEAKLKGLLTTVNSSSNPDIFKNDPYFQNQIGTLETTPLFNARKDIMIKALNNDFDGSGKPMMSSTHATFACNSLTPCNLVTSFSTIIGDIDGLSLEKQDQFWNSYKANYLAVKQRIQSVFINAYAQKIGAYNGCIGLSAAPVVLVANISTYSSAASTINSYLGTIKPSDGLCSFGNSGDYQTKQKRFLPTDMFYNAGADPVDVLADIAEQVNYQSYVETGVCPLARDLEIYLDGYFRESLLSGNSVSGSRNYTGQYLAPSLFEEFGGQYPASSVSTSGSINGQQLTLSLISNPVLDDSSVTINLPFTYQWSGFGSSWAIIGVSNISAKYNPTTQLFEYSALARLDVNGTYKEIVISGTTKARISDCSISNPLTNGQFLGSGNTFDETGTCNKETYFSKAMMALMNSLIASNTVNASSINITSLSAYANSYLPEFFEGGNNVVWSALGGNVYVLDIDGSQQFQMSLDGTIPTNATITNIRFEYIYNNDKTSIVGQTIKLTWLTNALVKQSTQGTVVETETTLLNFSCCGDINNYYNPINEEDPRVTGCTAAELGLEEIFENHLKEIFNTAFAVFDKDDPRHDTYTYSSKILLPSLKTNDLLNDINLRLEDKATVWMESVGYVNIGSVPHDIAYYRRPSTSNLMNITIGNHKDDMEIGENAFQLWLHFNNLGGIPFTKEQIEDIKEIVSLDFTGFPISGSTGGTMKYLNKLDEMELSEFTFNLSPVKKVTSNTATSFSFHLCREFLGLNLESLSAKSSFAKSETNSIIKIEEKFINGIKETKYTDGSYTIEYSHPNNLSDLLAIEEILLQRSELLTYNNSYYQSNQTYVTSTTKLKPAFTLRKQVTNNAAGDPNDTIPSGRFYYKDVSFTPQGIGLSQDELANVQFSIDFDNYTYNSSDYSSAEIIINSQVFSVANNNLKVEFIEGMGYGGRRYPRNRLSWRLYYPQTFDIFNFSYNINGLERTYNLDEGSGSATSTNGLGSININNGIWFSDPTLGIGLKFTSSSTSGDAGWDDFIPFVFEQGANIGFNASLKFQGTPPYNDGNESFGHIVHIDYEDSAHPENLYQLLLYSVYGDELVPPDLLTCTGGENPCIAQPVAPLSCTDKYQTFSSIMTGLGITNQDYDYVSEADFCKLNYGYITDAYEDFLQALSITNTSDVNYISIGIFGATEFGYGYNGIQQVIDAYAAHITANASTPDNVKSWAQFTSDYLYYNLTSEGASCISLPASILTTPSMDGFTYPEDPDKIPPCEEFTASIMASYSNDSYDVFLKKEREDFINAYLKHATENAVENFTMSYQDKEYQYTLYYYDQAGNLKQTVSPEGVDRFTKDDLLTPDTNGLTLNDKINVYRNANTSLEDPTLLPNHQLKTQYEYNSLNQLVWQSTPDGGVTRFAYDALGRIIASQNAKQLVNNTFSYTAYDALGRITEAGELVPNVAISINEMTGKLVYNADGSLVESYIENTLPDNSVETLHYPNQITEEKHEVTKTVYTLPVSDPENIFNTVTSNSDTSVKANARNRVTGVYYYDVKTPSTASIDYQNALFYNYDIHGNVVELAQHNRLLAESGSNPFSGIKRVQYEYDLISGNVNKVYYQKGDMDQFIHKYEYDADNRIVNVQTSSNGYIWETDASYDYFAHGPLARTVLGDKQVQGMDYAYTLQGWLKGVNANILDPTKDLGADGTSGSNVAKDAMGYALTYFGNNTNNTTDENDYASIGSINAFISANNNAPANVKNLYNGNIKQMATDIAGLNETALGTQINNYTYDQLNRIKDMQGYDASGNPNYSSSYMYDRNGNLEALTRNAVNGSGTVTPMDNFVYQYNKDANDKKTNNKLRSVQEVSAALDGNFSTDIDSGQALDNYVYDDIGQLISDAAEGITNIDWRVDGKVASITKNNGAQIIKFTYDGLGNRIAKTVLPDDITTLYARDAQGNVLAVYETNESNISNITANKNVILKEHHIYGSSRLGIEEKNLQGSFNETLLNGTLTTAKLLQAQQDIVVAGNPAIYTVESTGDLTLKAGNSILLKPGLHIKPGGKLLAKIEPFSATPQALGIYARTVGDKRYELSNHLGNVLSVVTDRKLVADPLNFTNFTADVLTYNDYYPFGMLLPNRHGSTDSYRYGFQGQEKDDEIKGEGNSLNYTFRMHDPRVGRFFAVDPIGDKYPFYSPYQFSGNRVIDMVELEGLEPSKPELYWFRLNKSQEKKLLGKDLERTIVFKTIGLHKLGDNKFKGDEMYVLRTYSEAEINNYYYDKFQKEWISFKNISCLSCDLNMMGKQVLDGTVKYGAPTLMIVTGVVAIAAALPTGGSSLAGWGAVYGTASIIGGSYSVGAGTAILTMELKGDSEAAKKIPTSYYDATISIMFESLKNGENDKKIDAINGTISLVGNVMSIRFGTTEIQKLDNSINVIKVTIDGKEVGDDLLELFQNKTDLKSEERN